MVPACRCRIWALFVTAILVLLAMPILSGAMIMLLFDQTIGTHFFAPAQGGQPLLWQHLFWFFGHPEVYILILPAMGMVVGHHRQRHRASRSSATTSMVLAIVGHRVLGWIVWGHHMFMSGMNPTLGTSFMISTMLIAVPSAIKVFNWLGTMWRGNIRFHVPMLHAIALRGDVHDRRTVAASSWRRRRSTCYIHDTYFIVAHLHYVLFGGSLFAHLRRHHVLVSEDVRPDDEPCWGKVHFLLTFIFYNLVFFPMHNLRLRGAHAAHSTIRRITTSSSRYQPINDPISICAFLLFATQIIFCGELHRELVQGEEGIGESVGGQRARVDHVIARPAWKLGDAAHRLPRAV